VCVLTAGTARPRDGGGGVGGVVAAEEDGSESGGELGGLGNGLAEPAGERGELTGVDAGAGELACSGEQGRDLSVDDTCMLGWATVYTGVMGCV
jgi:transcription elongation factor